MTTSCLESNLFNEILECGVRYYNGFRDGHGFVGFGFRGGLVCLKWFGGFLLNLILIWEA